MRGPTTNGLFCVLELFHYRDKVQYMFYQMCKFYLAMAPHGSVFSRYFPLPFHRHFELVFCHDVIVQIKSRDFTAGGTTVNPCCNHRRSGLVHGLNSMLVTIGTRMIWGLHTVLIVVQILKVRACESRYLSKNVFAEPLPLRTR